MLIRFKVSNLFDLHDVTLDFRANSYNWNSHVVKDDYVKNAMLFGQNASGKSRILNAIYQISQLNFQAVLRDGEDNTFLEYVFKFGEHVVVYKSVGGHNRVITFTLDGVDIDLGAKSKSQPVAELVNKFYHYVNNLRFIGHHHDYPIAYMPDDCSLLLCDNFAQTLCYERTMGQLQYVSNLNCQVIGATNETALISNDYLRPDCYFNICDGQLYAFSELTEKALHKAHNLEKMYRAGAFTNTWEQQ